jgi:hypothetical protein
MTMIKLEAGKYYKTREGQKAYVVGRMKGTCDYPWIGQIGDAFPFYWTDEGVGSPRCVMVDDLVEEWKEPETGEGALYVWRHRGTSRIVTSYYQKETHPIGHGSARYELFVKRYELIAKKTVRWTEGEIE